MSAATASHAVCYSQHSRVPNQGWHSVDCIYHRSGNFRSQNFVTVAIYERYENFAHVTRNIDDPLRIRKLNIRKFILRNLYKMKLFF